MAVVSMFMFYIGKASTTRRDRREATHKQAIDYLIEIARASLSRLAQVVPVPPWRACFAEHIQIQTHMHTGVGNSAQMTLSESQS